MWSFDVKDQQMFQQYAQGNIDQNQAKGFVQQFVQKAPPDEQQQIFQQDFAQMSPDQRAQLAKEFPSEYHVDPNNPASMAMGMTRMKQEHPDMLHRILDHPVWLGTAVALASMIAKRVLQHHH